MIKDGYQEFFNFFRIDENAFLRFAEQAIIYVPKEKARIYWNALKKAIISSNETVIVRSYSRHLQGRELYDEFYKQYFPALIDLDRLGNQSPTLMLQELTGFIKGRKANIQNYQVSHIFGRTKNPYAFCAPWNVVYLPKILDPFTGHESKGELTEKIIHLYQEKMFEEYGDLISEYNQIMDSLSVKIEEFISSRKSNDKIICRFHQSLREEFSQIYVNE